MSRTAVLLLAGTFALSACFEEEPKSYDKNKFAGQLAEVACMWAFACCDSAEQASWLGSSMNQTSCVSTLRARYDSLFASANEDQWQGQDAASCIDSLQDLSASCPRAFDIDTEMDKCTLVKWTMEPGDLCQSNWDCSTKFCKNGVCAKPLAKGSQCAAGDRCDTDLKCVNGTCVGLQPDGAVCTDGSECYSGACAGGKCVSLANYTCDGA